MASGKTIQAAMTTQERLFQALPGARITKSRVDPRKVMELLLESMPPGQAARLRDNLMDVYLAQSPHVKKAMRQGGDIEEALAELLRSPVDEGWGAARPAVSELGETPELGKRLQQEQARARKLASEETITPRQARQQMEGERIPWEPDNEGLWAKEATGIDPVTGRERTYVNKYEQFADDMDMNDLGVDDRDGGGLLERLISEEEIPYFPRPDDLPELLDETGSVWRGPRKQGALGPAGGESPDPLRGITRRANEDTDALKAATIRPGDRQVVDISDVAKAALTRLQTPLDGVSPRTYMPKDYRGSALSDHAVTGVARAQDPSDIEKAIDKLLKIRSTPKKGRRLSPDRQAEVADLRALKEELMGAARNPQPHLEQASANSKLLSEQIANTPRGERAPDRLQEYIGKRLQGVKEPRARVGIREIGAQVKLLQKEAQLASNKGDRQLVKEIEAVLGELRKELQALLQGGA